MAFAATGAGTVFAQWHDAQQAKPTSKPTTAQQLRVRGAQETSGIGATELSATPLKTATSMPVRLQAPSKAITEKDVPSDALQLTSNMQGFQMANESYVFIEKDTIYLTNFYGLGGTVKAKVNMTDGTFTIHRQEVFMSPTYGQVDIMSCDPVAGSFDKEGTIAGSIADNKVEIGPWVAIILEGQYANYSIANGVHKGSTFAGVNASMESKIYVMGEDSVKRLETVKDKLYVEATGTNALRIFNLASTGGKVETFLNSDKTFRIAPTQLFQNSNGYFFCYPANWERGEVYQTRDIIGTSPNDSTLTFPNWGIYSNNGKYYYRQVESSQLTLKTLKVSFPESSTWAGSGTEEDPYQIGTVADLLKLSETVNGAEIPEGQKFVTSYKGVHFKVTKAINLKGLNFPPIGGTDDMKRFGGVFNGDNKTISYLTVSTGTKGYAGLFGAVDTCAVLKNISLSNPTVSSENYYYTGAVAGFCMGTVDNCKVTNGTISGHLIVGGVLGSSGPATNLSFTGTVTGSSNIGGVIGNMRYPCSKLSATNTTVTCLGGGETYSAGGVLGYLTSSSLTGKTGGEISDSYFSGKVILAKSQTFGGGIAGCSVEANISRCFSIGEIIATAPVSQMAAGGIVGAIQGIVMRDCYFTGNMEVPGQWAAPLAGYAINVQLAGHPANSEITNCYIACHNRGTGQFNYTPYLGWFDTRTAGTYPVITNCRIDGSIMPRNSAAPGFSTLAQMTSATAWEGFDPEIWKFEDKFYPTLKTIPANSAMNVSKAPIYFTDNDNTENVSKNFTVPTANAVSWKVLNNGKEGTEGHGIIISGANMALNGSVATDTLVAINGQLKRWIEIKLAPATLFTGSGTAEDPYKISTKADLIKLSSATTTNLLTFDGSYFLITADIDLENDSTFLGISNCTSATYKFGGILDGGNHFIHRAKIVIPKLDENGKIVDGKTSYRGFIGRLKQSGAVRNLRLADDCTFIFYSSSGAFVGENNGGVIENCRNYARVEAHAGTSGGIVGYNRAPGIVSNCLNAGDVIGGFHYVGGITAYNYGTITNCQNAGKVATELINTNYSASQLAGAGGIVNANFGYIDNCLNTGKVWTPKYSSGLVGWYNTTPPADPSIVNSLNLGIVECTDATYRGEIVGHQYKVPKVTGVYWDNQTGLNGAADNNVLEGASGLTTARLVSGEAIEGFDAKLWAFEKGKYPYLKSFADEPAALLGANAVADFGKSVNRSKIVADATLSTAEGLKWTLRKGDAAFAVKGNSLEMTAMDVTVDTLVANVGTFSKVMALNATPLTLEAPEVTATVTADKKAYELVFTHLVEGVTYWFTLDNTKPGIGVEGVRSTDGKILVEVPADCTLRAIAAHRSYFPSPEVTKELTGLTSGIGDIDTEADVTSRTYYNAQGVASDSPWQGVNIIVTTLANGKISVAKRTVK